MNEHLLNDENREELAGSWRSYLSGNESEISRMSTALGISADVLGRWKPMMQNGDDDEGSVVRLYGPIVSDLFAEFFPGTVSGRMFEEALEQAASKSDDVTVRINSPGGSVIEAAVIYDAIAETRKSGTNIDAHISGLSGSAASMIMMAANNISISAMGAVFVHNPMVIAYGNVKNLRSAVHQMEQVEATAKSAYAVRYNDSPDADHGFESLDALMEGEDNDGTWLSPELAQKVGFVDSISQTAEPDADPDATAGMSDRILASLGIIDGSKDPQSISGVNPNAITATADGDPPMDPQNNGNEPGDQPTPDPVATTMAGLEALARLAEYNGVPRDQAGAVAMRVAAEGGDAATMATQMLELPQYHEKPHSKNVKDQISRQGPVATIDGFLNLVASANPNSGVARSYAEEKHAIEHQWQQDIFEKDGDNLHNMLKSGAGELIPTSLFWSGEREVPIALIDTYSARDVMPSRIDFARTMPELVARTPIIKYVTQATERSATVHIPVVTDGPDINNQALGISAGAVVGAETTEPDADDMTVTTVVVRPEIFDAIVNIPAVSDILTEGWTQRVAYENIQDKLASDFEKRIVQGAQALTSANTAVEISNAIRTGGGKALHRSIIGAGSAAFKANVPIRNSAYVFGSDIFDLLLVEPVGAGGGRTIISGSTEENVNPMIEGELNGGVPAIKSNQLSAGGSSNQAKEHQGIYGAWSHCQLTNWAYMRAWLDNNNTRLWKLKFVTLAAITFIRGPAFTDLTVTTA